MERKKCPKSKIKWTLRDLVGDALLKSNLFQMGKTYFYVRLSRRLPESVAKITIFFMWVLMLSACKK